MPDINSRIAERVRTLRAGAGMSLEALAGKCDVSRSMISLIERGECSPTAVVLDKIATGLAVPLASLFEDARAPVSPVSRGHEHTAWRDPLSGYVRRNISPPNYPSPMHIVDVIMPPGAKVAYETGARENVHQQVWVQDGALEVTVGKITHRLEADDCLAMQLDRPIGFRNPTRYIVTLASERARGWRKP
jgi:transcriptional regulator with XRE-family HTH domain